MASHYYFFLDGHSLWWDVSSLLFLSANNVFPFSLPYHTSIRTQPNDNGTNLRWVKCLEKAASLNGMQRNGFRMNPSYFNIIFREGWKIFLKAEREDLLCFPCNNTTSAWQKRVFIHSTPSVKHGKIFLKPWVL